jgi:hypothetical protein
MALKKLVLTGSTAALLGIGGLATSLVPAAAYIACNNDGDCWHTDSQYHPPGMRFDFHHDDWYFHRHWDSDRDRHWREYHEGRGYYRGGVWVTL